MKPVEKTFLMNLLGELNKTLAERHERSSEHGSQGYIAKVLGLDQSLENARSISTAVMISAATLHHVKPGLYLDCSNTQQRLVLFEVTQEGKVKILAIAEGFQWKELHAPIRAALYDTNRAELLRARGYHERRISEINRALLVLDQFGKEPTHEPQTATA